MLYLSDCSSEILSDANRNLINLRER